MQLHFRTSIEARTPLQLTRNGAGWSGGTAKRLYGQAPSSKERPDKEPRKTQEARRRSGEAEGRDQAPRDSGRQRAY
jgi:hypothetical protein